MQKFKFERAMDNPNALDLDDPQTLIAKPLIFLIETLYLDCKLHDRDNFAAM